MNNTDQYLNFKPGMKLSGFSVINAQYHPEIAFPTGKFDDNGNAIKAAAYEMLHEKSGAKLVYIENEDPDMSFSISFKTPPKDNTGVFHILEHSVLCGSRKFPVKEPFTYLLKSSMQTFLNAITFPDKTMYPVASTNMKDLINLTDVYMDAVLFPNLYKDENIFRQEGHHQIVDDKLNIEHSGVVLNEMKGAYGDSAAVLFEELTAKLFPNTCYQYDSGGKPGEIENLTFQQFLDEHASHYRLDNSYIILYGNMDVLKMLKFLDNNYLSNLEEIKNWRLDVATPTKHPRMIENQKAIIAEHKSVEMNTAKENSIAGCAYVYSKDMLKRLAIAILVSAIASTNETPLKSKLLEQKIGTNIVIGSVDELMTPLLVVEVKQPKSGIAKNLRHIISDNVKEIVKEGIDKKLLSASLERAKFVMKEKLPNWSSGVDCAISLMGDWLYNESCIQQNFETNARINKLEQLINTDYFDKLAVELFCDNKHNASVEIIPVQKDNEKSLKKASKVQASKIQSMNQNLVEAQSKPDSKENINKLPKLNISDIGSGTAWPELENIKIDDRDLLKLKIEPIGISYFNMSFPLTQIKYKDLTYLTILALLLGNLDTTKHSAAEIHTILKGKLGGFTTSPQTYCKHNKFDQFELLYNVGTSCLDQNAELAAQIIDEILRHTNFSDTGKIKLLLEQAKTEFEQSIISSGHTLACSRASSYYSKQNLVLQHIGGMDSYFFIKDLLEDFDNRKADLTRVLNKLCQILFSEQPIVSVCSSKEGTKSFIRHLPTYKYSNPNAKLDIPQPKDLHEGFIIPGTVSYAGLAYNTNLNKVGKNAANVVASKICSLNYLWEEIRVKGGAYGAGINASTQGKVRCYSYRDPNLTSTITSFRRCMDWLLEQDISKEQLTDYIISAVAVLDAPQTIRTIFKNANTAYFTGKNQKLLMQKRKELLEISPSDIAKSATNLSRALQKAPTCVFGSKEILKDSDYNIVKIFK